MKSEVKLLKSQLQLTEARLMLLTQKTFQKKSEKHNDHPSLPFEFNEAEVTAYAAEIEEIEETTIKEHTWTRTIKLSQDKPINLSYTS